MAYKLFSHIEYEKKILELEIGEMSSVRITPESQPSQLQSSGFKVTILKAN